MVGLDDQVGVGTLGQLDVLLVLELLLQLLLLLFLLGETGLRLFELLVLLVGLLLQLLLLLHGLLELILLDRLFVLDLLLENLLALVVLGIHAFRFLLEVHEVADAHAFHLQLLEVVNATLHQVLGAALRGGHEIATEVHAGLQLLLEADRALLVLRRHLHHALRLGDWLSLLRFRCGRDHLLARMFDVLFLLNRRFLSMLGRLLRPLMRLPLAPDGGLKLQEHVLGVLTRVVEALLLGFELADTALDAADSLLDGLNLLQDSHLIERFVVLFLLINLCFGLYKVNAALRGPVFRLGSLLLLLHLLLGSLLHNNLLLIDLLLLLLVRVVGQLDVFIDRRLLGNLR